VSVEARFPSARLEQLKMIQAVITRMAGASADVKKISMAVVGVGLSTAFGTGSPLLLVPIAALALVFAGLDAMYLRQERWFRKLYDGCLDEEIDPVAWRPRLTPDKKLRESVSFMAAAQSWSVLWFHGPIVAVLVLAFAHSCVTRPVPPPAAVTVTCPAPAAASAPAP